MGVISEVSPILSMLISFGTLVTMIYTFTKFLQKPQESLQERVLVIESDLRDVHRQIDRAREGKSEQDETNKVLIHSVLALIEFEIQYCLTEHKEMSKDLVAAKEDLHNFLARK